MKKIISFLFFIISLTLCIDIVNAKEIAKTCKYKANDGYNTIYIDIYDDNSTQAYVKKYLNSTEGDGKFTTYSGNGNTESVLNWNEQDTTYLDNNTCPKYVLITNSPFFEVNISDNRSTLEEQKGDKEGYVLDNDTSFYENFATCEYLVQYISDSYMKFKIEIKDENYTTMSYMKNGEEIYYNSNFDKLLLNPTVFGVSTSMINDIGSSITSEQIYYAYQNKGNTCPYIIATRSGGNVTLSVSDDSYHDGVNSFSSEAINEEYSEKVPEQVVVDTACVSHYNENAIPAIQGAEFEFKIYSDGKKEFCTRLEGMNSASCDSFYNDNDSFGITVGDMTFTLSENSIQDFFSGTCIGSDFYIYEEAGIVAGSYILTTDKNEAGNGTYFTQGQEGPLESHKDQHGFNPNRVCADGNCDINLNNFCGEPTVASVLRFIGLIIFIAKILVPAIIIIMGFVNLFKIMTSGKEDEAKKQVKNIIRNIVIGILIFLLPSLIKMIFDMADNIIEPETPSDFSNCVNCLTEPNSCEIPEDD